jgi:hypothetical protein
MCGIRGRESSAASAGAPPPRRIRGRERVLRPGASVGAQRKLWGCWRWSRSERRRLIVEPSPPHLADATATTCAPQVPTPPLIWSTPPQPLTRKFQWERREGGDAGERDVEVRWEK